MASPKAKYSKSASSVTNATANATIAVEPHKTIPTANGISTAAVATRFQVIEKESPQKSRSSSHHIEGNKSRPRGFDPHADRSFSVIPSVAIEDFDLVGRDLLFIGMPRKANSLSIASKSCVPSALQNFLIDVERDLLRLAIHYEVDRLARITRDAHLRQPHHSVSKIPEDRHEHCE